MLDLNLYPSILKTLANLDIFIHITLSQLPLKYIWNYSFMPVCKNGYKPVSYLSKECQKPTAVKLIFQPKRTVTALSKHHNCTIGIEAVGDSNFAYDLFMLFAIVSFAYGKAKLVVALWANL